MGDSLSWSLTVFRSLHLNCHFWRQNYSMPVVGDRQRYFVLFPYDTNQTTGLFSGLSGSFTVAEIDLESIAWFPYGR